MRNRCMIMIIAVILILLGAQGCQPPVQPTPTDTPENCESESGVWFLNPYQNDSWNWNVRGQLHAHSNVGREDGTISRSEIFKFYMENGFSFVSITDHDRRNVCCAEFQGPDDEYVYCLPMDQQMTCPGKDTIFCWWGKRKCTDCIDTPCCDVRLDPSDPSEPGIFIIGEEAGKAKGLHTLMIGIPREGDCRYGDPEDFDISKWVPWIINRGGLTFAAHASMPEYNLGGETEWTRDQMYTPWLSGLEIGSQVREWNWDDLLRNNRRFLGIMTEDRHGLDGTLPSRWVQIRSPLGFPYTSESIVAALKRGDFYSIQSPSSSTHPKISITTCRNEIRVFVEDEDKSSEFWQVRAFMGNPENYITQANSRIDSIEMDIGYRYVFKVNGDELYARIKVTNSNGNEVYSQPVFIFGNPVEDCVSFSRDQLSIANIGRSLSLVVTQESKKTVIARFPDRSEADRALAIIDQYHMDRACFLGRDYHNWIHHTSTVPADTANLEIISGYSLSYYAVGSQTPTGNMDGEDCISFYPSQLKVFLVDDPSRAWVLGTEHNWLFSFEDREIEAYRALDIIRHYGFTHACYVGRPDPSFIYFRR